MLPLFCFSGAVFPSVFHQLSISWYFTMASRLLIGDNNLSKFWPAYQFGRPSLKGSTLVVATDLDTLDNALAQAEDREQVLNSFLLKFEIFQCLAGFQSFNVLMCCWVCR